ncbi:unnamed protein product, partial [Ectocarpus sp. 12 AP-2014]
KISCLCQPKPITWPILVHVFSQGVLLRDEDLPNINVTASTSTYMNLSPATHCLTLTHVLLECPSRSTPTTPNQNAVFKRTPARASRTVRPRQEPTSASPKTS